VFVAKVPATPTVELVPTMRRVLGTARTQRRYRGALALTGLTDEVACELHGRGVLSEALPLYREVLDSFVTTLGPNHALSTVAAQNLGACLASSGELAEALPLLERALARLTQLLGEEDVNVLKAVDGVAAVRLLQGDAAGAETLLRKGQATLRRLAVKAGLPREAAPPGQVAQWNVICTALAHLLLKKGEREEAEALLREVTRQQTVPAEAEERLLKARKHLGVEELAELRVEALEAAERADWQRRVWEYKDPDSHLRTCAQCGPVKDAGITMKICSVCLVARYCGAACQKLHWKAHKPECKRIQAQNAAGPVGSDVAGPASG